MVAFVHLQMYWLVSSQLVWNHLISWLCKVAHVSELRLVLNQLVYATGHPSVHVQTSSALVRPNQRSMGSDGLEESCTPRTTANASSAMSAMEARWTLSPIAVHASSDCWKVLASVTTL